MYLCLFCFQIWSPLWSIQFPPARTQSNPFPCAHLLGTFGNVTCPWKTSTLIKNRLKTTFKWRRGKWKRELTTGNFHRFLPLVREPEFPRARETRRMPNVPFQVSDMTQCSFLKQKYKKLRGRHLITKTWSMSWKRGSAAGNSRYFFPVTRDPGFPRARETQTMPKIPFKSPTQPNVPF